MFKNMKTVSIIIPAYNEEKRLPKTLEAWKVFLQNNISDFTITEIIIVDDGSKDKTLEIAGLFKKYLPVKTIKIKPNQGKGNAVRAGVKEASGDLIFIYDADAAVSPDEINKLLSKIDDADIVIGSRTAKGADAKMSLKRKIIGICFHLLCSPLLPGIKDASCGAKLFKTGVAKKIFQLQKIDRFAFDIEVLWLAREIKFQN